MHTGVKLVDSDKYIKPSMRSRSLSNTMRLALACDVCMPFKNSSMVAQYVIDSLSVVVYGSGSYMSLTVYTYKHSRIERTHSAVN